LGTAILIGEWVREIVRHYPDLRAFIEAALQ
jgi:hypothetical protein